MARLYEWETFLQPLEHEALITLWEKEEHHRGLAKGMASARDSIRRKCVQRARNAQAKLDRAAYRARTTAQHEEGGA